MPVSSSATSTGRRRASVGLDWSVEDRACQTDVTLCRTVRGRTWTEYS